MNTDKLKEVFHPNRFKCSAKLTAVFGALFGEEWATPTIVGLICTSDDFVMAQEEGDIGYNRFFSNMEDMERNIRGAAEVAIDDPGERKEFCHWAISRIRMGFEKMPSQVSDALSL